MTRLLAAFAFLTRVPIRRPFDAGDVARASVFFPLVGAAIGALQCGAVVLVGPRATSFVAAVLAVALSAWLTRGLHLDGLADFVDGLGGGRTPDDVLRIMKDSRIGAFGAMALFIVLAAKIAAIEADVPLEAIVLAPVLSRWTVVALGCALPYARSGAPAPSEHIGKLELGLATFVTGVSGVTAVLVVGLGHGVLPGALVIASASIVSVVIVSVVVVTVVVGAIAKRRIGGVTGDVLGANVELAETAALVVATL